MSVSAFTARLLQGLAKEHWRPRQSIALAALVFLSACADGPNLGEPGFVDGFAGAAVADEPYAALAGRDMLSQGGGAGDAAAAMFFTLAVTKPASAGMMASGICLGYDPEDDHHQAYYFQTPSAVRAFAAIHARFGRLPWRQAVGKAEAMARFGVRLSKAFVEDWQAVPAPSGHAADLYGYNPKVGDMVQNLELAGLLGQIRQAGAGSFYNGRAAAQVWAALEAAGLPPDRSRWRKAIPSTSDSTRVDFGNHHVAFAPFEGTPGPAEAGIWPSLEDEGPTALAQLLASARLSAKQGAVEETAFVAADGLGTAVACNLTMGRPFGTGQLVSGTFAANPATPTSTPILISSEPTKVFFAAVASAGTPGWASAAALERLDNSTPLADVLRIRRSAPAHNGGFLAEPGASLAVGGTKQVDKIGRVNGIICLRGLPNYPQSCDAAADPRGKGYAAVADSTG